jgi:hypothetical protein
MLPWTADFEIRIISRDRLCQLSSHSCRAAWLLPHYVAGSKFHGVVCHMATPPTLNNLQAKAEALSIPERVLLA